MYTEYFELSTLPFENTPDPRFFFGSDQHHEALAAIEYTVRMRKGFVMVSGNIGSGKTTVARTMMQRCAEYAHIVQVTHGLRTTRELLHQVLHVLDETYNDADEDATLRNQVQTTLVRFADSGRPVVLLIDEAQTLSDEALEELRLLSNFDSATTKLVQVVLIGQPELRDRVCALPALCQRVAIAKQLEPLSLEESYLYIIHRLRAASLDGQTVLVRFTAEALCRLHGFADGAPRIINFVCDNCMLLLFAKGESYQITDAIVCQVIRDLLPNLDITESADTTPPAPQMPTIVTRPQAVNEMTAIGSRRIDRRPHEVMS